MFNYIIIVIITTLLLGCVPEKSSPTETDNSGNNEVTSEAVQWIKNNAIPIYDANLPNGYNDLLPLESVIGNAKIVALGEMTYGTHECQSMKLQLIDFLVNEMDFNIICLDVAYPESEYLNNYIKTIIGDPDDLLFDLVYWRNHIRNNDLFLNSQEILDLIVWMREYNRNSNSGFDLEFIGRGVLRPQKAMTNIVDYINSIDSSTAQYADSLYSLFQQWSYYYPEVNNNIKFNINNNINMVLDTLVNLRDYLILLSSAENYERALYLAKFVINAKQALEYTTEELRDPYRVDLIKYIMNEYGPNSKMILWGYNNQVGNFNGNLGNLLKYEYGQDYINIGFNVNKGYFNARLLNPDDGSYSVPCVFEFPSVPEDSYENYFQKADIPMYFLDIQSNINPPGSQSTDWLYGPMEMKNINMFYEPYKPELYFNSIGLKDAFDAIIYIEETTESELKAKL
jgi:erythromycin esterase